MKNKFKINLPGKSHDFMTWYIPVGIILGITSAIMLGFIMGPSVKMFFWMGELFLNALKMLIIPLVISTVITGVSRIGDISSMRGLGLKTIIYIISTTLVAVMIGLIISNSFAIDTATAELFKIPEKIREIPPLSVLDIIRKTIPPSIVKAMADMDILGIIFFSVFFGVALSLTGEKGEPVLKFFSAFEEVMMKMVHAVIFFSPVGIFGLISGRIGESGGAYELLDQLWALRWYVRNVVLGLAVHGLIFLPFILFFFTGIGPIRFFKAMFTPLITAFSTASSSATIPVTLKHIQENLGVPKKIAGFVIPLGATINMNGTALYEATAVMFIAGIYQIDMTFADQIAILLTATVAAIGAAGIPEAGLVTMVLVLQAVGLPLEGIGLILAIDWFLDRIRTSVNVMGDAIGAAVVTGRGGLKQSE
jgi:Na+/H+-dicarboxylate symporter